MVELTVYFGRILQRKMSLINKLVGVEPIELILMFDTPFITD